LLLACFPLFGCTHPNDIRRFANIGAVAAIQGVQYTSDTFWISTRLGANGKAGTSYQWRDLSDAGVGVTKGTAAPAQIIDRWVSYAARVRRIMNNDEAIFPEHAMTRIEASRRYALDNAHSATEQNVKGSLAVGKCADLVVLIDRLLAARGAGLVNIQVDCTFVGGEMSYRRDR
jgi:predicted amidohydrolase YtcJ